MKKTIFMFSTLSVSFISIINVVACNQDNLRIPIINVIEFPNELKDFTYDLSKNGVINEKTLATALNNTGICKYKFFPYTKETKIEKIFFI